MGKDDVLLSVGTRATPQTERADPRQVQNRAGGYVFEVDYETSLRRFLTIGTAGGTYYASARDLAKERAQDVMAAVQTRESGIRTVEIIKEISTQARAPKNDYAIFALAVTAAFGDDKVKHAAYQALPAVCRTATHLFTFVRYLKLFQSLGGNGFKRAVGRWYNGKPVDSAAYQMVKYRARQGFSHRDALRLAHPDPQGDQARDRLYRWAATGTVPLGEDKSLPKIVRGFEEAQRASDAATWARLIGEYGLTWEMLPDAALNEAVVWKALLDAGIGQTALIRQLSRLTRHGVVQTHRAQIVAQLTDPEQIRRGRIHPFNALVALKTYSEGHGFRSRSGATWVPDRAVVDALDAMFYTAFTVAEPTGKRHLIAIDVSGSMSAKVMDSPLSAREAAAAMAMSIARVEPDWTCVAFTSGAGAWSPHVTREARRGWSWSARDDDGVQEISISPRQRLDDIVAKTSRLAFGRTDCALPFLWAQAQGLVYDVVSVWSDQETWSGPVHVHQALRDYRAKVNPQTRFVAAGMCATDYSVAEPGDPLSLNVSGLDAAVPALVAGFSRGEF